MQILISFNFKPIPIAFEMWKIDQSISIIMRCVCLKQHTCVDMRVRINTAKKKKLRKIENMFVLGKKVLEFFPVSSRTFITSFIGIILSAHTIIAGIEKHVVLLLAIIT